MSFFTLLGLGDVSDAAQVEFRKQSAHSRHLRSFHVYSTTGIWGLSRVDRIPNLPHKLPENALYTGVSEDDNAQSLCRIDEPSMSGNAER